MLRNDRGLTLIEILAALVILSIVIIVFINISGYVSLTTTKSDKKTVALQMAEAKITEIRNTIAAATPNINTQNIPITGPDANGYSTTVIESQLLGTTTVNTPSIAHNVSMDAIVTLNNGANYESRLITVIVSWGGL